MLFTSLKCVCCADGMQELRLNRRRINGVREDDVIVKALGWAFTGQPVQAEFHDRQNAVYFGQTALDPLVS